MQAKKDRFDTARRAIACAIALVLCLAPAAARAQLCQGPFAVDPEWGDAPEGAQAYPDLGIPGVFPTCFGGPSGCIQHAQIPGGIANNALFGPGIDYEPDGNGGQCPPPFYENDECDYSDGDAGLVRPTPFTFAPQGPPIAQPCRAGPPVHLYACTRARWGRDIDITLSNNLFRMWQAEQVVYLNVLADFDRSGDWQAFPVGPLNCSGVQVPEHIVRNMPVPIFFSGLASQLGLADFDVSADSGYVWFRFTLSPEPVLFPWTGEGFWEGGETEDYMLHISSGTPPQEFGDAPYGVDAYPDFGVQGQFPTCTQTAAYLVHPTGGGLYFGSHVDFEYDGNAGDCSFTVYDRDECFGGDAGLIVPRPYTIQPAAPGGVGAEPCAVPATDLGLECTPITWGAGLDMQITNAMAVPAYLNMLADWNQNGRWGDPPFACTGPVVEHVLRNVLVPAGFSGQLSQLATPLRFMGRAGFVWTRFTLSTIGVPLNWDGSGNVGEGETEDYLLRVAVDPTDTGSSRLMEFRIGEATPNPTFAGTQVELDLPAGGSLAVEIYDARGRRIRDAGMRAVDAGVHHVVWDGLDAAGKRPAAGVYFVRLTLADRVVTRQVLLLN
jgi:hypothetical protein